MALIHLLLEYFFLFLFDDVNKTPKVSPVTELAVYSIDSSWFNLRAWFVIIFVKLVTSVFIYVRRYIAELA